MTRHSENQDGGTQGKCDEGKVSLRRSVSLSLCLSIVACCLLIFPLGCSRKAQLENAQSAWDSGDYTTAAERYEEFLKQNPQSDKSAFARLQAATVCRRDLKQYDRAIQHYLHFIEDFPKSPDLYQARLSLAECYTATQKLREAISEYESALPAAADTKEKRRIRLKIADLYYDLKDLGQAMAEYKKVTDDAAYDELCEKAYLQIGGIHLLRDEFDEAIPSYRAVVQYTQDPPLRRTARIRLADCYERTFAYEQAIQTLKETEVDPASPDYIPQRIASIQEQQRQRNISPQATLNWKKK